MDLWQKAAESMPKSKVQAEGDNIQPKGKDENSFKEQKTVCPVLFPFYTVQGMNHPEAGSLNTRV